MYKYLKNGLLIFTNNGLKRIEDIDKTQGDKILIYKDGKYEYGEIDNIEKIYKKHYKLNKINFINSIESFYTNDNIEIKSVVNILSAIDSTMDIPDYLDYNKNRCINMTRVCELSSFDYIGFPTTFETEEVSSSNPLLNDSYRFMGLLLSSSLLSFYINKDKEKTINFISEYLKRNDISYEISEMDNKTVIKYDNQLLMKKIKIVDINDILKVHKEQLMEFVKGLIEIDNEYVMINKDIYQIIKYACLRLGVIISSYYRNDKYHIKISRKLSKIHFNYFNYDETVWNKIRNIKKIDYNGFLYKLVLMDDCPYLTEIGLIS